MSQDADLIRSLREASIDYTALQLRFLHEYKGMLAEMLGPEPDPIVQPKDAPEHKRESTHTTLSDVLYESARYSMAAYAHWLQLTNKQLDFLVDALGTAGKRGRSRHLYGPYEQSVTVKDTTRPGGMVKAAFRVNNPYPFEASASFETLFLCGDEGKVPIDATFTRTDGKRARDYLLPPSGHGAFEVEFEPRALTAGRHRAETVVSVDGRQGCCLVISFATGKGAKTAAKKKVAKKKAAKKRPAARKKLKSAAKKRGQKP